MAKTLYRVKDHNASNIMLIDLATRGTVLISRAHIASLAVGWGEMSLTTTGGAVYRVTRGVMPRQRRITRAAFNRQQ